MCRALQVVDGDDVAFARRTKIHSPKLYDDARKSRRSGASRKLTTVKRYEIEESELDSKIPNISRERERERERDGGIFGRIFGDRRTDGRFVLLSPSLRLFLDPRETRVPLSLLVSRGCWLLSRREHASNDN